MDRALGERFRPAHLPCHGGRHAPPPPSFAVTSTRRPASRERQALPPSSAVNSDEPRKAAVSERHSAPREPGFRLGATEMLWLFAYGSLIFRPGVAFSMQRPGFVDGYARRLWQGSSDHRGLRGAEGRVVTLVPSAGIRCRGVLFGVGDADREVVLSELDRREQGGYERCWLPAWFDDGPEPVQALAYVAHPANPEYLGEAPLAEIVRQVRRAHGPSGSNADYVLALARALRDLGVDDDHVLDVAAALESP